jgi:hypothetical protein
MVPRPSTSGGTGCPGRSVFGRSRVESHGSCRTSSEISRGRCGCTHGIGSSTRRRPPLLPPPEQFAPAHAPHAMSLGGRSTGPRGTAARRTPLRSCTCRPRGRSSACTRAGIAALSPSRHDLDVRPAQARSALLIDVRSSLALDTKVPGGHCLTDVGSEDAHRRCVPEAVVRCRVRAQASDHDGLPDPHRRGSALVGRRSNRVRPAPPKEALFTTPPASLSHSGGQTPRDCDIAPAPGNAPLGRNR